MNASHIYSNEIPDFISDALETPPLVRLKNVGMNCGCEYTSFPRFAGIDSYSRYEHSLGTALIVWHFTQDKAQSMAALLHDISTPVFAHVVDFLKGDYMKQEATEADTESFIRSSPELLSVLAKHSLRIDAVKDYHIYPIADNETPKLSSDRLEYTVGNMINFGFAHAETAKTLFENIVVRKDELVFTDRECALQFAEYALACSKVYVSDEDRYSMQLLSELLKDALRRSVLSEGDLHTTEPQVIEKLAADERSACQWKDYVNLSKTEISAEHKQGSGWRRVYAKKRFIDPYTVNLGRVSETDSGFARELHGFLSQSQDHWIRGLPKENFSHL